MSTLVEVTDPQARFVDPARHLPEHGRGAWTTDGIGFSWRYELNPDGQARIGSLAGASLDHWAVAAGCAAIQDRLQDLGQLRPLADTERGLYGPDTTEAVRAFQADATDPADGAPLAQDGTVGRSDARALFTPVITAAERRLAIPARLLRGEVNHESALDPGAVGYYIYYGATLTYRGVDRGSCQINSKAHPDVTWRQSFDLRFAVNWSAKALRARFDTYRSRWPDQRAAALWDAAVCGHNSPLWGQQWAEAGAAPNEQAAAYVAAVKAARY